MKIPKEYDVPAIQEAVSEWETHYKQAFKRKWTQLSATKAFNRLLREGLSQTEVIEAIDHSIEMGYRGIFRCPARRADELLPADTRPRSTMTDEQRMERFRVANLIETTEAN